MKRILCLFAVLVLCLAMAVNVFAANGANLVVDDADLLSSSEENALGSMLKELSDKYRFEVVVVTTPSCGNASPMAFADDYYDYNGYGYDEQNSGVLLLISMEERDWWISGTGKGVSLFDSKAIDYLGRKIVPYLSDGDYYGAFSEYAKQCGRYLSGKGPERNYFPGILISLAGSLLIAMISTASMKSKLKTVKTQTRADNYMRGGSLYLTNSQDVFDHNSRTFIPIPRSDDSSRFGGGGGGGVHFGSSGTSHSGGGGKF